MHFTDNGFSQDLKHATFFHYPAKDHCTDDQPDRIEHSCHAASYQQLVDQRRHGCRSAGSLERAEARKAEANVRRWGVGSPDQRHA